MMSKGKLANLSNEDYQAFKKILGKYDQIQKDITRHFSTIENLEKEIKMENERVSILSQEAKSLNEQESSLYAKLAEENGMEIKDVKEAIFHIFVKSRTDGK